jgi:hypothetical protein
MQQSIFFFLKEKKQIFRPAIRSERDLTRLSPAWSGNLGRPPALRVFYLG